MFDQINLETFTPHLNSEFTLQLPDVSLPAVLVEAKSLGKVEPPKFMSLPENVQLRLEPFALVFRLPQRPALPQAMYTLNHPELGELPGIFLVPIAENAAGRFYESIFN